MSVPAAYLGVVLIWSTTPLAIQWSSDGSGFLFGVVARMSLGLLIVLLLLALLRQPLPWRSDARRSYLAAGLGIYAAMMLVYWSAQRIPSGLISVIFGLTPIATALLNALLGEGRLDSQKLLGMLLGVVGLGVIFLQTGHWGNGAGLGFMALLISVGLHASSAVAIKRIDADIPALATTAGGLLVATPLYLLSWLISHGLTLPAEVPIRSMLAIGYLALFGSVVGFFLYYYVLKRVSAVQVALITLITPVTALLLGKQLNQESIPLSVWLGSGLILVGLAIHERLFSRLLTKRKQPTEIVLERG